MSDLETYRSMLRINKHRLDDELEIQPDILERISMRITELSMHSAEKADEFKRAEAAAFIECKGAGDADKMADANAKRDPFRVKAFKASVAARQELDEWQGLYESWKQRGYSLKELVSLYVAQYFSVNPNHNVNRAERPQAPARRDYSQSRNSIESTGGVDASRTRRRVAT